MPDGVPSDQALPDPSVAPLAGATISETPPRASAGTRATAAHTGRRAAEFRPPVNLRFTVPFLGKRFYFALVGGKERRGHERIALERRRNPIKTRTNLAFVFIGAMVLYMLTLGLFLVYAAVIEV